MPPFSPVDSGIPRWPVSRRHGAGSRHGRAELSPSSDAELGKDPVEVRPDCARRQDELSADLAIGQALNRQTGNFEFLRRQSLSSVADATTTRLAGAAVMMTGALWPHTQPSAAMLAAYAADPALAAMRLDFSATVREVLQVMIAGLLARSSR